jgi:hypothetical protein
LEREEDDLEALPQRYGKLSESQGNFSENPKKESKQAYFILCSDHSGEHPLELSFD